MWEADIWQSGAGKYNPTKQCLQLQSCGQSQLSRCVFKKSQQKHLILLIILII